MTKRPLIALALTALMLTPLAHAQGAEAARQAAADRYLRAVPTAKMVNDTIAQLALQLPPEQRQKFAADLRVMIDVRKLEKISRDAMVKTFSVDELNALADFYESRHGASAMAKFGAYMGEVMPPMMREIQAGVERVQAQPSGPPAPIRKP